MVCAYLQFMTRPLIKGLITLTDDFKVVLSEELKRRDEAFVKEVLLPYNWPKQIELPERFAPQPEFIAWHRNELLVDDESLTILRVIENIPDAIYYIMSDQPDCCPKCQRRLDLIEIAMMDDERVYCEFL